MYLQNSKKCINNYLCRRSVRSYHEASVFGFKEKSESCFQVSNEILKSRCEESNFYRLVTAYRQFAHLDANINPVALIKHKEPLQLDPQQYGFDYSNQVSFKNIIYHDKEEGTISEAIKFLNKVYRKNVSIEFLHIENQEEVEWLCKYMEELPRQSCSDTVKIEIATELLKSQVFDLFLATKFPSLKRYGGEGAESMMAFFYEFFKNCSHDTIEQIVIGMPHRGRLNFLTSMLKFPPIKLFAKLKGQPEFPKRFETTGDVLSHFISSTDLKVGNKSIHISLLYNPSHLEAVNPVSMGKTRAKQLFTKDGDYNANKRWSDKILNIQVHGDAAFIGQGVNQECLAMCRTPHFNVGGTVHLIVNNQVGFTTPPEQGRSCRYCSDVAKMISSPIIHVNGDYPELVVKVAQLAFNYQRKFRKDIFVDLNCYRQRGHNEVDDPTITNPHLYKIIHSRETVPNMYSKELVFCGILREDNVTQITENYHKWLNTQLNSVENYKPESPCFTKQWEDYEQAQPIVSTWETGIHKDLLILLGNKSVSYPPSFNVHQHLIKTHIKSRIQKVSEGNRIDWSSAEAIAIGSLLYEGYNVRLSGQDVGRGTFSHRHVMLVDQESNNIYIPLNDIHPQQQGFLEVANSILSEEAVLGYEYGMSIENPRNLIIWEAQFGDFFNGAQVIFDTFIASGESKWLWSSGLVVLLPHGYDGAGPEHSSARIERFLQLTDSKENEIDGDNINIQVCQPSTPSQYFHLLRRQMVRNYRKPLIIITPKTLLRLPHATSNFGEMETGTSFLPVIGDSSVNANNIKKVIISSGKHFYNLLEYKHSKNIQDTALIRLESFCPFPASELHQELGKYVNAAAIIWSQEEPQNMGAWTFIKPRFENLLGKKIKYCGRNSLPAPAVGMNSIHQKQALEVVQQPFII